MKVGSPTVGAGNVGASVVQKPQLLILLQAFNMSNAQFIFLAVTNLLGMTKLAL